MERTDDGPSLNRDIALATWGLFVGLALLLLAAGMFGTLLGVRSELIKPSVDQVRLYLNAFVGNCGRAPTRIEIDRMSSNDLANSAAAMETKPGASPH